MSLSLIAFIAICAVMMSASESDERKREVSDIHWIIIGILGMIVALSSDDLPGGVLAAAGYLMFMLFMFSGKVEGHLSIIVIVAGSVLLMASSYVSSSAYPIVTLVMTLVFLGMFFLGLMKGGADVKALVTLSFVFPAYPDFGSLMWDPVYPAGLIFNPVFSMFFIALILASLYAMVVNLRRSHGTRISSYITSREDAESGFVWVLEEIDGDRVRVTPMVPFIVPLTMGYVFTMIFGCPLFAFI